MLCSSSDPRETGSSLLPPQTGANYSLIFEGAISHAAVWGFASFWDPRCACPPVQPDTQGSTRADKTMRQLPAEALETVVRGDVPGGRPQPARESAR